jgi:hypothetical protein
MAAVDGHFLTEVVSVTGRARPSPNEGRPYLVITNFYPPSGGLRRGRGVVSLRRSRPARPVR